MSKSMKSGGRVDEVLKHVPALDGVRGLAVSLVLCLHIFWSNTGTPNRIGRNLAQVTSLGWVGVDLFFVLSGFLITGILFDSLRDKNYFRTFYARRALRILPLYYAVLFITFLFFRSRNTGAHPLLLLCAFLQNSPLYIPLSTAAPPENMLTHFWSLAVEEQFYLLWPLVVYLVRSREWLMRLAVLGLFVTPVLRVFLRLHGSPPLWVYYMTITRADTLLMGGLLALAIRGKERDLALKYALPLFWAGITVVAAILVHQGSVDGSTFAMQVYGFSALAVAGAGLIGMTLRRDSRIANLFSARPLRFLGKYSYGLYMLHVGVLGIGYLYVFPVMRERFHSLVLYHLATAALTIAVLIPLALLSYRFFEQPLLGLKRYFRYDPADRNPVVSGESAAALTGNSIRD